MLTAVIRDKQALVVPEVGAAKIERTPKDPPFASLNTMKVTGSLDKDGVETSQMEMTLRSDAELIYRAVLHQVAPAQYDEFAQRMWSSLGFAGVTAHAEISRPEDTTEPLTIRYGYKREQAGGKWDEYQIVAQLMPDGLPTVDEKTPPVSSLNLGAARTEISEFELKLPEGWRVELPEAIHQKAAFANCDVTYRFEKGTLYVERRLVILNETVPASDWKVYKKWHDGAGLGGFPYVQLVRSTKDARASKGEAAEPAGPVYTSSAEAEKLVAQAIAALNAHDAKTAAPLLDKARELNANQKGLWGARATMSLSHGEMTEAIHDYEMELELHPDSTWVYGAVSRLELLQGKRDQSEDALRRWAEQDSSNPTPTVQLMSMLVEDDRAGDAVGAGSAALKKLPEDRRNDPQFQLALGQAQLKAGMGGEGETTLVTLLNSTDDPRMMNNVAYALADAGHAMALVSQKEGEALARLTTETQAWTLDESLQTLRAQSALLLASWDTMGWIEFHGGRTSEAKDYLEAAWRNLQSATVGEHLGDVKAKLGDFAGARAVYELALATIPPYDMMGVHKEVGPEGKRLKAKIEQMNRAGAKVAINDAQAKVQGMRRIPLGPANGRDGVAEYKLLMSADGITRVAPTTDQTLPGAVELIEKAKLTSYFPRGSEARLVRVVMLNCHSGVCELVLEP
jgi:tetratricopeptide (TPR) repeat protein